MDEPRTVPDPTTGVFGTSERPGVEVSTKKGWEEGLFLMEGENREKELGFLASRFLG